MTEKFSIISAIQGRTYPTDDVTIITDIAVAREITRLIELWNDADADDANTIDEEVQRLREVLRETSYVFHMRGIAPGVVESINEQVAAEKHDDDTDANVSRLRKLVAAHIVHVTDHQGRVDDHLFTDEDVEAFETWIPRDQIQLLLDQVGALSLKAYYHDLSTSADFLSKS